MAEDVKKQKVEALINKVNDIRVKLRANVFGQDMAIEAVVNGYFQAEQAGGDDDSHPKATFLFAGPPGVGKTLLASKFAQILDDYDDSTTTVFKRFDMSGYSQGFSVVELFGESKAFAGAPKGELTSFVSEHPICVLLFDEIEKANINVIHQFLQILDGGKAVDKNIGEVSFKDAILIFTTNAGKQLYDNSSIADLSMVPRKTVINALRRDINPLTKEPYFPEALCSRFASGNVVMFNHMTADSLIRVAKGKIDQLVTDFQTDPGIYVEIDDDVYTALILAEGASADARTISGRAASFFNTEIQELLTLIYPEGIGANIADIQKVFIRVNFEGTKPEVKALFRNDNKPRILVFADEEEAKPIRRMLDFCDVVWATNVSEAEAALKKYKFDLAMIDLRCGVSKETLVNIAKRDVNSPALNIEDIESPARDFYWYLLEKKRELPIYLLYGMGLTLTEEEQNSYRKHGVRGFLNGTKDEQEFKEAVRTIVTDLYHEKSMERLARENKLLTFETKQNITAEKGNVAQITLFDFELETAVDAEDTENILSVVSKPDVKFGDVIGAKEAKAELRHFIGYLKDPRNYIEFNAKTPRGVILYGPSGTGKTMLARAMAGESQATFLSMQGNEFRKRYLGEGSKKVHDLFSTARKYAPSIIFIDEIDAIAKERQGSSDGDGEVEATLTAFLAEMDGFSKDPSKPVFVLAATNFEVEPGKAKSLDQAFMRRFDSRIFVGLPKKEDRKEFLRRKINGNKKLKDNISTEEIESITVRSAGMSLAKLDSVIEHALRVAIAGGKDKVTNEALDEAFEEYIYGDEKNLDDSQRKRVARHEAGHVIMGWYSGEIPPYVTIVSHGNHGGYTQYAEKSGKPVSTRKEIIDSIRADLGGRAAEIMYYGEDGVSTGVASDLESASKTARNMVCTYGMDDEFGLDVVSNNNAIDKLLANEIRTAVNRILKREMEETLNIITAHREELDALVDELMDKNHLSGEEIKEVLGEPPKPQA